MMRHNRALRNDNKVIGNIQSIRDVEDSIRATKKYTKGAFRESVKHPIQGEQFPSKVLTEYYEVYPFVDLSWDMPASTAWAWVWGDEKHIDVFFKYDYRSGRASLQVQNGPESMKCLKQSIPGFDDAVQRAISEGREAGDS